MKLGNCKIENTLIKNSFFIKVFGCQYNEWDAARLAFALQKLGLEESIDKESADLIFILNCSVRKSGVDRALGFAENTKRRDQRTIVTGCILKKDRERFKKKDVTIWNNFDIDELKIILKSDLESKEIGLLLDEGHKTSNYIPITKGCNNFCSYCAVPYVRGREVSRPTEDILKNVEKVVAAGHKDIWLLGQNVNSYKSLKPKVKSEKNDKFIGFAELLRAVNDVPGDFQIYFTSNHPKDMSDEIIESIASLIKVVKLIHLPVQSGSDKILKAMNRPYTRDQYLKLIDKIKLRMPEVKLTTDSIVGFPGETEEDFQETVNLFREVKFFQAYNNKYSPREGTAAFNLGDPIPWEEKERRWKVLNSICNQR